MFAKRMAVMLLMLSGPALAASPGPGPAPAEIIPVKQLATRWFKAVATSDLAALEPLYLPDAWEKARKDIQRMPQMLELASDPNLTLMLVKYADTQADAVSHPFQVDHPEVSDRVVIVLHMEKRDGEWLVRSNSGDSLRSIADSYDYFRRKNPQGRIWFAPDAPQWLRPEPAPAAGELDVDEIFSDIPQSSPTSELVERLSEAVYDKTIYESWFADDPNGAAALQKLYSDRSKDPDAADHILAAARNGLRNSPRQAPYILSYLGNKFIWAAQQQNAQAIELMYYASFDRKLAGNAVYYGLSVIKGPRPPHILKRLVELCMIDESTGRILWGTRGQHEEMIQYLLPWSRHADPLVRDRAAALRQVFQGSLNYDDLYRQQKTAYDKALLGDKLPLIRRVLAEGSSTQRRKMLDQIRRRALSSILDESFREPLLSCLSDPHPEVRCRAIQFSGDIFCKTGQVKPELIALMDELSRDEDSKVREAVAVFTGSKWVWTSGPQDPGAVDIMIRLAGDIDRETRNAAVYYGLSVLANKSDAVIEMMVDLALDPSSGADVGRIGWGLSRGADKDKVKSLLTPHLKGPSEKAEAAREIYGEIFKTEPPR